MSNANSNEGSSQSYEDNAPLWKYVTKVESNRKGGGNVNFKCHYCQSIFQGSYSRVKHHLLKIKGGGIRACNKVTQSNLSEMQCLVDVAEMRVKNAQVRHVSLPTSRTDSSSASHFDSLGDMSGSGSGHGEGVCEPKNRKGSCSGPLEKAYQNSARKQLDGLIARMFCTSGLSFNLARNPYYVEAFSKACSRPVPGYNALKTTLLQNERSHIGMKLEAIKNAWKVTGVSLCSDGWSNSQRRPLINMMTACDSGPMFLKAINCEGETKNALFISNLLDECIREIGPQNTDSASASKAARQIIEAKYGHIFWTPCVVHTLNLALKNICTPKAGPNNDVWGQCIWISNVVDECWAVKNYIMNHQMRLAMFNRHSKLKFLSIADTRFASIIVMMRRYKEIKLELQRMVVSEEWDSYQQDDVEKEKSIKEKILNDVLWSKIDYIRSFTSPIYDMLRKCDTNMPCLHLVCEWWDCMIEEVKVAIYRREDKQLHEDSEFF